MNLTEIIITLSAVNSSEIRFPPLSSFEPETSDVRLNVYWSIFLILSVRDRIHIRQQPKLKMDDRSPLQLWPSRAADISLCSLGLNTRRHIRS